MMRQGLFALVVILLSINAAHAGKIYGSLQVDGKAVKAGTKLSLNCSGKTFTAKVQNHGRYSVNVSKEGPCTLTVSGFSGASSKVVSYEEATRYNFILSRSGNSYSMKRK